MSSRRPIEAGAPAPPVELHTLDGQRVALPTGQWTHLSFLRYASCPMCNLRVRELNTRARELGEAGIEWFAIFHSPERRLKRHMPNASWPRIVPDHDWKLGGTYRTTRSWLGLSLSIVLPSFYWAFLKTLAFGYWGGAIDRWFHSMPADFLIRPDGTIAIAHYGRHIGDHVAVDEILTKVAGERV